MGAVQLKWVASTLMTGVDSLGNSIVIGRWPEADPQWNGLKASDLLLLAAASCSTYDVVTILKKQRQTLVSLEVRCTGDQMPDPPYTFTKIHLHYTVRGEVSVDRLTKAIQLSEEKYCSVITSLKPTVEFTHSYEILV